MNYSTHSNILLQRHRCGYCAEQVTAIQIMRQENCQSCNKEIEWQGTEEGSNLFETLEKKWKKQKWVILALIGVVSLFSGQIPMLQSLIMIIGFIAIHIVLIRKPLQWFSTQRRVFAKLNIKLIGALISVVNLLINVLIFPFACVNGFVLSILGVLNTFIFVHFSMNIIKKRLSWETNHRPFGAHDWLGPVLVISSLFFVTFVGLMTVYLVSGWMMALPVPLMGITIGELLFGGTP
jgi:hypothetical protein